MTIHILSAGRSGSAWLCAVLQSLGLASQHDGYPAHYDNHIHWRDVNAETGWLWHPEDFFKQCQRGDTVIILNRPQWQIEDSVGKLLGMTGVTWDALFEQWERFKEEVKADDGLHVYEFDYVDLFKPAFAIPLYKIMPGNIDYHEVKEALDFFRHMRITNKSIEQDTKDTYVRHQPQGAVVL